VDTEAIHLYDPRHAPRSKHRQNSQGYPSVSRTSQSSVSRSQRVLSLLLVASCQLHCGPASRAPTQRIPPGKPANERTAAATAAEPATTAPTSAPAAAAPPTEVLAKDWPFCPLREPDKPSAPPAASPSAKGCTTQHQAFVPCAGGPEVEASVTRCCRYTSRTKEFFVKRCTGHLDFTSPASFVRVNLPGMQLEGPWNLEESVYVTDSLADVDLGAGVHVLSYEASHHDLDYGGSSSTQWTLYAFDGVAPAPILGSSVGNNVGLVSSNSEVTWLLRPNHVADLAIDTRDSDEQGFIDWRTTFRFQNGSYQRLGEPEEVDSGRR